MLGYVFDDTVLVSLGSGDHGPGALLAALDNRDIRVCIPVVTLSYVFAVLPPQRCVELLGIIEAMPNAAVEPLSDGVAALELAEFVELVPGDASAAHALAAARKQEMEIITVDRGRWRRVEEELSFAVPLVELTDED